MFAQNKSSQTKRSPIEEERERQEIQNIRETLKKINLQVITEDNQFEVTPENFTE